MGKVFVGRTGEASSIGAGDADTSVAGTLPPPADGFGRNDTLIGGDTTPTLLATIASIPIKGAASGSAAAGDFFGLTAEHIGALMIGTKKFTFDNTANDFSLDTTNGDFHA